jgi:capsular polysaccharide biosynthesis protein
MQDVLPFQREAFEIIKNKFELIEDLSKIPDYEIVSIYGAIDDHLSQRAENTLVMQFVRNLFLENLNYKMIEKKRIFITRKHSENQHQGILKRYILNEIEFVSMLKKYNFEYIQLEEYSTESKIKLFMESEIVISSNSGGLTMSLLMNNKSKLVEILNNGTIGFPHHHYINSCKAVGVNYFRYNNINEDQNGNFHINVNDFEKYLQNIL